MRWFLDICLLGSNAFKLGFNLSVAVCSELLSVQHAVWQQQRVITCCCCVCWNDSSGKCVISMSLCDNSTMFLNLRSRWTQCIADPQKQGAVAIIKQNPRQHHQHYTSTFTQTPGAAQMATCPRIHLDNVQYLESASLQYLTKAS